MDANDTIGNFDTLRCWQVAGEPFVLDGRYKVIDYLGSGAYGVVCAAHDSADNCMVAIKKCRKIFTSRTLAKRTLREIRLLRNLAHENVIKVKTLLKPFSDSEFSDIYIVFEIMETDLAQIIRSPQILRDQHVQFFTYQILLALQYIHSINIIHRDLKPRNLLVNSDCCLKIADFGLARIYTEQSCSKIVAMTEYVTTRWYRAPEILVGWGRYTAAIDMWAVGCIIAELIGRSPLFPGSDSQKQMQLICQCTGKPSNSFIHRCRKQSFREFLFEMPDDIQIVDLVTLYSNANPLAIDLISRLLRIEPDERLTATEALKHPYFSSLASSQLPTCSGSFCAHTHDWLTTEQFSFEEKKLTIENLRDELIHEIRLFNSAFPSPDGISNSFSPVKICKASAAPSNTAKAEPSCQPEAKDSVCTDMAGLCGNSLLSCVESDYSVRGFYALAPDTCIKADGNNVPVSACEDNSGTIKVHQQKHYACSPIPEDDTNCQCNHGLRSLPAFSAGDDYQHRSVDDLLRDRKLPPKPKPACLRPDLPQQEPSCREDVNSLFINGPTIRQRRGSNTCAAEGNKEPDSNSKTTPICNYRPQKYSFNNSSGSKKQCNIM